MKYNSPGQLNLTIGSLAQRIHVAQRKKERLEVDGNLLALPSTCVCRAQNRLFLLVHKEIYVLDNFELLRWKYAARDSSHTKSVLFVS